MKYLPNGFYNFTGIDMTFNYEEKKNVILTVGRLGTAQKATNVLLEAFVAIAEQIPEWNLHLAGTVEKEWKDEYLKHFWERFPELKNHICFLGQISDREALYQEYLNSQIFALSSKYEGGCPNVIAEALYAGDAVAITKINEYRDTIDNGNCGLAAEAEHIRAEDSRTVTRLGCHRYHPLAAMWIKPRKCKSIIACYPPNSMVYSYSE